ncbi:phage distal tail protein, Rcc01695 family [Acuticoccus sp.]|uniref:phage distal tail protein, Rcc01695 family n=1 Tax=Acuticoccus sp. TaxID=1904378 RepID=UPI003B521E42
MDEFHDVRFPLAVSFGATGGPERRTEIVTLGSGQEERNQRWAMSRRRYDAGTGVRNSDDLAVVVDFFEERRGRLYGFRYRDPLDHKSCAPSDQPSAQDQLLGVGDGSRVAFQLIKQYGDEFAPYDRPIVLPVAGTLLVEVGGVTRVEGGDFTLEKGLITFRPEVVPQEGQAVTAGYQFDVPVRFETDRLEINLSRVASGSIPSIPVVEITL